MSSYLALKTIFTIPELVGAHLTTALQIGRSLITYTPRVDQLLSVGHMLEAFADRQPANDNEPQPGEPNAEPAVAQSHGALVTYMEQLRDGEKPAPFWAKYMAADWLKRSSQPGANDNGRRLVEQVKQVNHLSLLALRPRKGFSSLKTMHSEQPPTAPTSVPVVTRPLVEQMIAQQPKGGKPKPDFAA